MISEASPECPRCGVLEKFNNHLIINHNTLLEKTLGSCARQEALLNALTTRAITDLLEKTSQLNVEERNNETI